MKKNKALFIYSGWMGDFLWIVPTIRALSKKYDSLSLVVSEQQKELAESLMNGDLDKIVEEVYVDIKSRGMIYRAINQHHIRKEAKNKNIGTYIDWVGKWKTTLCIPHSKEIDIYLPAEEDTRKREHKIIKRLHKKTNLMSPRDKNCHKVDSYLSVLKYFNIKDFKTNFDLKYNEEVINRAEKIIRLHNLRDVPSVALNIGSAQFSKIWPIENFKELAKKLQKDNIITMIFGADSFRWNNNYDARKEKTNFKDYDGLVSISSNPLLINAYLLSSGVFDISVACDSFPAHMAGSANEVSEKTIGAIKADNGKYYKANKTITLFGPTNDLFCSPYDPTGKFATIIRPEKYPNYCEYDLIKEKCSKYEKISEGESPCMKKISVGKVYEVIKEKLASKSQ